MGILNETFGESGTAVTYFGGQWWIVGLFLLLIFILFLVAYRVKPEGIIVLTILGLLSVGSYQIFVISEQITQTILLLLFIFVGLVAYYFFSK